MFPFQSLIESIPNYILIALIAISLAIGLLGYVIDINYEALYIFDTIYGYAVLVFLIKNGTFHRSKIFKYFLLSISAILIASVLMILHLPYGRTIMTIAVSGLAVVYFIYFLSKERKSLLGFSKLIFFVTLVVYKLIKFNHLNYLNEIILTHIISSILAVIYTYKKNYKISNWILN